MSRSITPPPRGKGNGRPRAGATTRSSPRLLADDFAALVQSLGGVKLPRDQEIFSRLYRTLSEEDEREYSRRNP